MVIKLFDSLYLECVNYYLGFNGDCGSTFLWTLHFTMTKGW